MQYGGLELGFDSIGTQAPSNGCDAFASREPASTLVEVLGLRASFF
jgi:hypothetical protein